MEHVLRACLIAMRLAERRRPERDGARDRLLRGAAHLGRLPRRRVRAGEVVRGRPGVQVRLPARRPPAGTGFVLRHLGAGRPLLDRARLGVTFIGDGRRDADAMLDNHWLRGRASWPTQLGLDAGGAGQPLARPSSAGTARARRAARGRRDLRSPSRLVSLADVRRGLPPGGRRRGGRRGRPRAARHAVRPGARRRVLPGADGPVRRPRRGDDLGRGDRRRARARTSC